MATFHFELVSPERLLFSGNVEAVVVPGAEGEFTVLDNHAPVMSVLKPGIVQIGETSSKTSRLFVRGGFADISAKGLTILAAGQHVRRLLRLATRAYLLDEGRERRERQDRRDR